MKWPTLKTGDTRRGWRFAWWPTPAHDGSTYWLVFLWHEQAYYSGYLWSGWTDTWVQRNPLAPEQP